VECRFPYWQSLPCGHGGFFLRKQWTIACPHQTAAAEAVKAWVQGLFAVRAMVLKPFHQKI